MNQRGNQLINETHYFTKKGCKIHIAVYEQTSETAARYQLFIDDNLYTTCDSLDEIANQLVDLIVHNHWCFLPGIL